MAVPWLDLVRYADSVGYHSDNPRTVWRYRDYVIDAFNRNLPFDQFTAVQLAGDLLPDASTAQRIASGYNRLLQTTEEGGAQAKEYRAIYLADRVRNASTVWLGASRVAYTLNPFDPSFASPIGTMRSILKPNFSDGLLVVASMPRCFLSSGTGWFFSSRRRAASACCDWLVCKRFMKRSTWPAVSTIRCSPV